ncbi:MAG: polyphosphate kinase 2 family protein [Chitinophagaceae bacterium]|nr:polyphosphate kinase 2 family protein [Chitinophagaceae bacterium]
MASKQIINLEEYKIKPGKKNKLKSFATTTKNKPLDKKTGEELLQKGILEMSILQDKLYANNEYSVLIVLQAMDAAGKDGTIKHLMSGLNPTGVKVSSFKSPSSAELDHDYFWRHYKELPARGEIGIFNRSHYENVLVTKVHPEYILKENIPGINSVKDIKKKFWDNRYEQIRRFEKNLHDNGTIILKFFLHVSKDEQKRRFLDRIDDPKKNWKFSIADMKERVYWDQYQKAYEEMFNNTSTHYAPWFVIPADDKWYMRIIVEMAIYQQFHKLDIAYPRVSKEVKLELQKAKEALLNEK